MTAEEALKWVRHEILSLCEATEDDPTLCNIASRDTEGKMGAFARGRIHEAKGIRRAMAEVIHEKLSQIIAPYEGPARDGIEAQHGLNDIYPGDPVA